ncbi:MAG: AAA family ATPase [Deltaproteobacteria bacterium]|nr:AAA family ATPase [Deltaproteobacteria bacterium]
MFISQIILSPFAGIPHLDLSFTDGLNVILGANEAGKSTVFHALYNVMFTEAKLTPGRFKKLMTRYLPIGGGDTIAVELHFRHKNTDHHLKRKWGPSAEAELKLPNGNIISDESTMAEYLGACLSASEGTYRAVLMTKQTGLAGTLEALKREHTETVKSLGDILKTAVLETDGVSIETFRDQLEAQLNKYYSRWDPDKNRPEGGRGIENSWKKQVGQILQAYYDKESVRVAFEKACQVEEAIDRANQNIAETKRERDEIDQYVATNKKAADDAQERKILLAQIENVAKNLVEYKKVNRDWPVREKTLQDLNSKLPEKEKEVEALKQKKIQAEQAEKNRKNVEKYKAVSARKKQVEDAEKNLKSAQVLTDEDLNAIDGAFKQLSLLKTELEAGRLSVIFEAKKPVTVSVTKDLEEPRKESLKPGESKSFEAGGRLRLDHPDWGMEVTTGEGDFADLVQKIEAADKALDELLKKHNVSSLEEAKKINRAYETCRQALKTAQDNLETDLGDTNLEELESSIKDAAKLPHVEPLAEVVEKLVNSEHQLAKLKSDLATHQEAMDEYIRKYKDQDTLLIKMTDAIQKEKDLKAKLDALAPLPEGVENVEAFIQEYKQKQIELSQLNEDLKKLEIERAGIHPPDQSSEELQKQLDELNEQFDIVFRKGKAILRVREVADELSEHLDQQAFVGLKHDSESFIAGMTDNRYEEIKIDESLPTGFIRKDGNVIETDLLSTGTLDVLGLALRLSMANYFLKDQEAFLVMDDPLVDMDSSRQSKAAELLKEYSKTKQLIIFTCHPTHADLLGGNRIAID